MCLCPGSPAFDVAYDPGDKQEIRRVIDAASGRFWSNRSLDDAFKEATSNMAQWLTDDYKLNPSEVGQVLGVTAQSSSAALNRPFT